MRKPNEIIVNGKTLNEILENHNHYLRRDVKGLAGMRANLRGANLRYANLSRANLSRANLSDADLRNANLRNANLRDADLRDAKNIPYIPLECPSEGSFIGWKKINKILIKLEIPEDARRSSATTKKCRCDKAKVLGFYDLNSTELNIDKIINNSYNTCEYIKGEMVYPDSFDEDRWNECSHGIHFFINKQDAINY